MIKMDYMTTLIDVRKEDMKTMIKKVKSYKSDIILNVDDVVIHAYNDDILSHCKENNINYCNDFTVGDTIGVYVEVTAATSKDKHITDPEYDTVADDYNNIEQIILLYENLDNI